jgi:hypothetical protein
VLIEASAIRVLEIVIDPGDREPEHVHRSPERDDRRRFGAHSLLRIRTATDLGRACHAPLETVGFLCPVPVTRRRQVLVEPHSGNVAAVP